MDECYHFSLREAPHKIPPLANNWRAPDSKGYVLLFWGPHFAAAVDCSMCGEPLGEDRVRDHDHMTGKYRGAAHSKCNMEEGKKRTKNIVIPVFFHNLKGYDGHLILSHVGKFISKLSAIPLNYEKMMSFSFRKLRFLDSAGFLASSLGFLQSVQAQSLG